MGEKEEGTWEIKGSKAVFTLGKDDALGTIKDDTLVLAAKDGKMTFERGRAPSPVAETELEEVAEEPVEEVPEEGAGEEGTAKNCPPPPGLENYLANFGPGQRDGSRARCRSGPSFHRSHLNRFGALDQAVVGDDWDALLGCGATGKNNSARVLGFAMRSGRIP